MLPQYTPSQNQYVSGIRKTRKHTCLGKIYINAAQLQKRKRRKNVRKDITHSDQSDPVTANIIAVALQMDKDAFNAPDGIPGLWNDQLATAHQLIGYAVRRVANEIHVCLKNPTPPATVVKKTKWTILRGLTTWSQSNSTESRYASLTNLRERFPGSLIRFDDEVCCVLCVYMFVYVCVVFLFFFICSSLAC